MGDKCLDPFKKKKKNVRRVAIRQYKFNSKETFDLAGRGTRMFLYISIIFISFEEFFTE